MERQEKMDYAAVVREYRTNGGCLKMKEWCQQEGYDYKVEIHHHLVDEMLIVIRGAIKAILVDDDKNIIYSKIIRPADGDYTSTGSAQVLCNCPRTCGTR